MHVLLLIDEVSEGLEYNKLWRLPYTWVWDSDINNSAINVMIPQGQIPAKIPILGKELIGGEEANHLIPYICMDIMIKRQDVTLSMHVY